jgi:hypothetical protein
VTLAAFKAQFPEFQAVPDSMVTAFLNAALLEINVDEWNVLADQGQGYLAAHKMALSPWGTATRMGWTKDGLTTYWVHYTSLQIQVTGGGATVV